MGAGKAMWLKTVTTVVKSTEPKSQGDLRSQHSPNTTNKTLHTCYVQGQLFPILQMKELRLKEIEFGHQAELASWTLAWMGSMLV